MLCSPFAVYLMADRNYKETFTACDDGGDVSHMCLNEHDAKSWHIILVSFFFNEWEKNCKGK